MQGLCRGNIEICVPFSFLVLGFCRFFILIPILEFLSYWHWYPKFIPDTNNLWYQYLVLISISGFCGTIDQLRSLVHCQLSHYCFFAPICSWGTIHQNSARSAGILKEWLTDKITNQFLAKFWPVKKNFLSSNIKLVRAVYRQRKSLVWLLT